MCLFFLFLMAWFSSEESWVHREAGSTQMAQQALRSRQLGDQMQGKVTAWGCLPWLQSPVKWWGTKYLKCLHGTTAAITVRPDSSCKEKSGAKKKQNKQKKTAGLFLRPHSSLVCAENSLRASDDWVCHLPPPIPTVYLTVSLELSFLIEDWLFKLEA